MLIFLICFRVWTLLGHVCDTGSTLVCGSPPIFSWYCPKKTTKAKKQKVNQRTDEKGCITWEVLIGTAWWICQVADLPGSTCCRWWQVDLLKEEGEAFGFSHSHGKAVAGLQVRMLFGTHLFPMLRSSSPPKKKRDFPMLLAGTSSLKGGILPQLSERVMRLGFSNDLWVLPGAVQPCTRSTWNW